MAAILAYVLNPLVRRLEQLRVPRVVAVVGVFAALILSVVAALLVLIIPAVGQVQTLIQNPDALIERMNGLAARARELPYVGERIARMDQEAITEFVQRTPPPPDRLSGGLRGLSA